MVSSKIPFCLIYYIYEHWTRAVHCAPFLSIFTHVMFCCFFSLLLLNFSSHLAQTSNKINCLIATHKKKIHANEDESFKELVENNMEYQHQPVHHYAFENECCWTWIVPASCLQCIDGCSSCTVLNLGNLEQASCFQCVLAARIPFIVHWCYLPHSSSVFYCSVFLLVPLFV